MQRVTQCRIGNGAWGLVLVRARVGTFMQVRAASIGSERGSERESYSCLAANVNEVQSFLCLVLGAWCFAVLGTVLCLVLSRM